MEELKITENKQTQEAADTAAPPAAGNIPAPQEQESRALLQADKAGLEARVKSLDAELAAAVASYRALAVQANPDVLPELVAGATVAEIEASVQRAREIVARVKQGVAAELSRERFPAGAPERGSGGAELSPREKIQRGITRE